MTRTITAYFDSRSDAQLAADRLREIGIRPEAVTIHDSTASDRTTTTTADTRSKGILESIGDFFLPDEDRYTYEEGIRRGGSVLTVRAEEGEFDRASDILEETAVDLDSRETEWRSEGWSGYEGATLGGTAATDVSATGATASYAGERTTRTEGYAGERTGGAFAAGADLAGREDYIPVAEERLRVGKREVGHGRVRIRSYVVETPVEESVSLRDERVTLDRHAVDRPATAADNLFQERSIEAQESIEEAVVSKDARVVEEVRLNKDVVQHDETVRDTVRRTEVEVDDERVTGTTLTEEERLRRGRSL